VFPYWGEEKDLSEQKRTCTFGVAFAMVQIETFDVMLWELEPTIKTKKGVR